MAGRRRGLAVPVYDSPNADMGYDIRDYEKIMSEFGTMEDFDTLLREMHKQDIKLVMDLVVNHSSDEHPWFVESRKSLDNPCRDYYIWRDGKNGKEPNNWSSFFTPSAWSYDEKTGQWYLHLFSEKQPDLNWENPKLREAVYAMMNRWFDRGVDGFRMDVISLIAKAPGLPDGQGDGYVFSPEQFAFQPKLHEYLREMRRRCFDGRNCMCVGETTFVTPENADSVVGDGRELDLLFQFDFMDLDGCGGKWNVIPFDLRKLKQLLVRWQEAIDWNTLFWGNHDQPRAVSRFGLRRFGGAARPECEDAGGGHVSAARNAVFVSGRGDQYDKFSRSGTRRSSAMWRASICSRRPGRTDGKPGRGTASAKKAATMRVRPCSGMLPPTRASQPERRGSM